MGKRVALKGKSEAISIFGSDLLVTTLDDVTKNVKFHNNGSKIHVIFNTVHIYVPFLKFYV